uniref:hypothetical protein n=1 Tax=Halobacteriovorax sp. TaxID=2020862 RepID=UPI003563B8C9
MENIKGFILTSNFVDSTSGVELHFYLSTNSGAVKVVITNFRPVFFIESKNQSLKIPKLLERKSIGLKSFSKQPVD